MPNGCGSGGGGKSRGLHRRNQTSHKHKIKALEKQNDKIQALEKQNEQLKVKLSALKAEEAANEQQEETNKRGLDILDQ